MPQTVQRGVRPLPPEQVPTLLTPSRGKSPLTSTFTIADTTVRNIRTGGRHDRRTAHPLDSHPRRLHRRHLPMLDPRPCTLVTMPRKVNPVATALLTNVQRFGWRRSVWLMDFLSGWALTVRHNDWQPVDVPQYRDYWRISNAKAFRDQQTWRAMFPNEPTPNDRVIAARKAYEQVVAEQKREPSRAELAALLAALPA
jgi:hypothetical protein